MNTEKLQVVFNDGQTDLTVREGKAIDLLPLKAPVKINISGIINAPLLFLEKRFDILNNCRNQYPGNECEENQLEPTRCHVIVEREGYKITLVTNENNEYSTGKVEGKLEQHPLFEKFGINTGYQWAPNDLAKFFKMHRAFFASSDENMDLVSKLSAFKGKVNAVIENTKDQNGSFADNFSGAVESNVPGTFKLKMPFFKGYPKEEFEVEFYASVNGRDFTLELVSPAAKQAYDEARDEIFDGVIKGIAEVAPIIPIIEK